ncbi:MAG: hypothetical protein E7049_03330 [Lentisphaerae bacterium]|nr:hypothetical protein [Lentisphaerota bacterium]
MKFTTCLFAALATFAASATIIDDNCCDYGSDICYVIWSTDCCFSPREEVDKGSAIGELPSLPSVECSCDDRHDWKCVGWYTKKVGGTKVTPSTIITRDVTFYARFLPAWRIIFNANGGNIDCCSIGTTRTRYVLRGKAIGSLPKPVRSGYTFKGWYTKKSGGTKVSTKTKATKRATFYAQWTPKKYTVKVSKKGKGTVSGGGKKAYKSKITLKAKPSKGYLFAGWHLQKDGELTWKSNSKSWSTKVPLGGATYVAVFYKDEY